MTYNKGNRTENRTRGGDAVTRYQRLKKDPSIDVGFDPDVAADHAYLVLFVDDDGDRAFQIDIPATDGMTPGVHIDGLCTISDGRMVQNHETGTATMNFTLRPVGVEWNTTAVTV